MSNPLEKLLQNGFADFDGLRIAGTIPLREEVVNDLIAQVLRDGLPAPATATTPTVPVATSQAPRAPVDPNALLKLVKSARVRMETGRVVLDFEIGV